MSFRLEEFVSLTKYKNMETRVFWTLQTRKMEKQVMTFNIRYDNRSDGADAWSRRKEDVCVFLLSQRPDFIGFQEALYNQVLDLDKALSPVYYKWFGVGRDDGKRAGEFNPIFYDSNKFELLSDGVFWLSLTPDVAGSIFPGAGCRRICQYGQFREIEASDNVFWHFNTHLDNASLEAREYGATLITKKMEEIVSNPQQAVFLTGDFNSTQNEQTYSIVVDSGLIDSQRAAKKVESHCTFTGFDNKSCVVIDFIFEKNFYEVNEYKVNTQTRPNGRNLSDHRPVQVFASFFDKTIHPNGSDDQHI